MSGLSVSGKHNQINLLELRSLALELKDLKQDPAASALLAQAQTDRMGMQGPPPGIVADNDPSQIYAKVTVNGETVATVYNSGAIETSNKLGAQFRSSFAADTEVGPTLAASRAERVAQALGGKIEVAASALNQQQWQSWVDTRNAGLAAYYNTGTAQIAAQEAASSASSTSEGSDEQAVSATGKSGSSAIDDFREFLKKSPIERLRDQILAAMGITEEDLAAMPPEKREAVLKEVAERVKDALKGHEIAGTAPEQDASEV